MTPSKPRAGTSSRPSPAPSSGPRPAAEHKSLPPALTRLSCWARPGGRPRSGNVGVARARRSTHRPCASPPSAGKPVRVSPSDARCHRSATPVRLVSRRSAVQRDPAAPTRSSLPALARRRVLPAGSPLGKPAVVRHVGQPTRPVLRRGPGAAHPGGADGSTRGQIPPFDERAYG
jgi:hypothetical protein